MLLGVTNHQHCVCTVVVPATLTESIIPLPSTFILPNYLRSTLPSTQIFKIYAFFIHRNIFLQADKVKCFI
jgi:hypothetical protein